MIRWACVAIVAWQVGLVISDIILARIDNALDHAIDELKW